MPIKAYADNWLWRSIKNRECTKRWYRNNPNARIRSRLTTRAWRKRKKEESINRLIRAIYRYEVNFPYVPISRLAKGESLSA
jgi:hypothetical protein